MIFSLITLIVAQGAPDCPFASSIPQLRVDDSAVEADNYIHYNIPQVTPYNSWLVKNVNGQQLHEVMLESASVLFTNGQASLFPLYAFEIQWNVDQIPPEANEQTFTYAAASGAGNCRINFKGIQGRQIKEINIYRLKKLT